ncbi:hypothetical protein H5410_047824 [Solanum commersonii]|uniref:Uncharacterized protein n=1 Tax=Solanum commersonii TaxID=4109 RepID=A0A9J5XJU4_SOLCO|nr:hypothetical protein H5410_047824 [Solanum commersonii]
MPQRVYEHATITNKIGNMSCLRYLRLEGQISGKLPNSIVKLKHLETLDVKKSSVVVHAGA